MNILFVNPPSPYRGKLVIRDTNRSGRISSEMTIWPQVGLAQMAAMFTEDNVMIIDCIAEGLNYAELFEKMRAFKPNFVVFNPISSTFTHDMIVAHYAWFLNAESIIISPLAEYEKEKIYDRFPTLTRIIGYSDEPECSLFEAIKGKRCEYRFENFPAARQDLLPIGQYRLPFIGDNYTFVIASRGCPYKCIYCRQTATWRGKVRYRSIASIVEEIKRYNLRNIAFHSDTFTLNHDWLYELCRRMPKGIRWICNSRVDTVTPEILKEMRRAGCWMICYGVESGNNEILKMNRKGATVEQAKQAIKWTKESGIKAWGYFMLGLYGDTRETMLETIKLSMSLPIDIANFSIASPYHGTEWFNITRSQGWLSSECWEDFDQNEKAIVDQPDSPSTLVKEMQREAYRRWYLSWRGIKFFFSSKIWKNPKMIISLLRNNL